MRSALARRPPAARNLPVARAARPVVAARPREAAPRAIQAAGATVGFLAVYGALTVLHELGHEPAFMGSIATIPLFARIAVSALVAPPAGFIVARLAGNQVRVLRALPAALAVAIGLVVLAILGFA